MPNPREEQLRNNRRLARQLLGVVALLLAVIGLFTVLGWVGALLRIVTDDTAERRDYEEKLYGLVLLDTLPFEDTSTVDPTIFREAAIWGTLFQIQNRDGDFSTYERDAETGSLILPRLEVDTYLANLLGPEYDAGVGSFETANFVYTYDEEKQGYLVPVTGTVGLYIPQAERIFNRGGRTYVTMGYIPTLNNSSDFMLTIPNEPTKYMDYVFERGSNRQMVLVALQESETHPAATPAPTEEPFAQVDPQDLVLENIDPAIMADVTPPPEAGAEGAEAGDGADAPADGEAAPAEGGDAAPQDDAAQPAA